MAATKAKITIVDVAKAAGVSVSTVSRVLNDKHDVAPDTYERVRSVIDELGYTSSLAARSMRSRANRVIGVLVIDLSDSYNLEALRGISGTLHQHDYDVIVYGSGRSAPTLTSAWQRDRAAQLSSITDGVIVVTPTAGDLPDTVPLVLLDPCVGENAFPSVIAQNQDGARQTVDYLIGLGHRRIGHIAGWPMMLSAKQRCEGYENALRAAGIPVDPALVSEGDYTRATALRAARRLLNLPDAPTAIFAANDQSALGVLDAAHEVGLSVPRDLSVVGFDNVAQAAQSTPPLTTVDQAIGHMASLAATMMMDLIQGRPLEKRRLQVPTRLVVRNSCSAPRQVVGA